jgi:hypothetical protein
MQCPTEEIMNAQLTHNHDLKLCAVVAYRYISVAQSEKGLIATVTRMAPPVRNDNRSIIIGRVQQQQQQQPYEMRLCNSNTRKLTNERAY